MPWLWTCVIALLASAPPLRIVVNIPAFRLDVYVADSVTRTMSIAPGMPGFRTPRGEFAISSVEWNPWWIPPDRPWAAKEKPMRPGPANPMGRVKLNFRPLYFLHGSPFERSIGTAASHGCIRLKNADAIELARLVHRYGTSSLTTDEVERLATDTATRLIALDEPIPIEIRYDRVEIRGGQVTVHRDVYGLATRSLRAELIATLSANGIDTTRLDTARVGALVRRVGPQGKSALVTSLIREP
jgi:murein L,D-transpeptidase YcbB/YkuD